MDDVLKFMREYSLLYRKERYAALAVSIITVLLLLVFFGYQLLHHKDSSPEQWTMITNAIAGVGSSGIIATAIGFIFKFMDKTTEAAKTFVNKQNNNNDGN
jgi:hypothetical protein